MTSIVALLYLLSLVAIGLWSARRTRDARDFFLAGRRLGLIPAALATMASVMSGFVFVGGPGLFYNVGLSSFWITISSSFTGAMMCWLLARPLKEIADAGDCLSIPDVLLARFDCRFSSGLAAVAILVGVIGYLATQLSALGVILSAMLPVSPHAAQLIGVGVLLFYSVAGGIVASVWTDVVQGAVMIVAAGLMFLCALEAGQGLSGLSVTLLADEPALIHPWGLTGAIGALSWFFVFAVGSLGQPHVVHKFMMVRDLKVLRFFPLILAGSMILCGLVWLGGGMAARALVASGRTPALAHPDQAITTFLSLAAPAWIRALAYAGILAAIMSTADTFVNVGAAALTRDLPRALGLKPKRQLLKGRLFSVLLFVLAFWCSRILGDLVAHLGIFGFTSFAAALTPALAIGLNWPAAGAGAARASILCGLAVNLTLEGLNRAGFYPLQFTPGALSLTVSLLVFVMVGTLAPREVRA